MTSMELATAISKLENWRAYSVVTLFHPEAIALLAERDAAVAERRRQERVVYLTSKIIELSTELADLAPTQPPVSGGNES